MYFVEVPGSDEQQNAVEFDRWVKSIEPWKNDVLRSNFTDIRPWFSTGARAMQEAEVQRRFAKLGESLWSGSSVLGGPRQCRETFAGKTRISSAVVKSFESCMRIWQRFCWSGDGSQRIGRSGEDGAGGVVCTCVGRPLPWRIVESGGRRA